jgi:hypothetical protein
VVVAVLCVFCLCIAHCTTSRARIATASLHRHKCSSRQCAVQAQAALQPCSGGGGGSSTAFGTPTAARGSLTGSSSSCPRVLRRVAPSSSNSSRSSRSSRSRRSVIVQAARDYYDVLGVSRSADKKQIKQAYRQKARKFHPVSSKRVQGWLPCRC